LLQITLLLLTKNFRRKQNSTEESTKDSALSVSGHTFIEVNVSLQKTLDLRDINSLRGFLKIISSLFVPKYIEEKRLSINKKRKTK